MDNVAIVAGAGGFIGRHMVRLILNNGMEVLALDRKLINIPGAICQQINLSDRGSVLDTLADVYPRWVFNLTGEINHTTTWPEQRELMDQHWLSMLNLVEGLDKKHPEVFINIGSSDEYGKQPPPQNESMREMPIAPYSAAKVAATQYLQMWHRCTGFPSITARFFLIYGPGQDDSRLIPWTCKSLLKGNTMNASLGHQLRDFLYVEDAVNALIELAKTPSARGEVFNVASGEPKTVREVLATIQNIVGKGNINFGYYPMREGEPMALYADISKIKNLTGWGPQVSIKEGIKKTVSFYLEQPIL